MGDARFRCFDAMADRVTHKVKNRIHHPLDQVLVDFGRLASQIEHYRLPGLSSKVADDERHAPEDLSNRHETDAHDPFAQRSYLAIDRDGAFLDRSPLDGWHMFLYTREKIGR